MSWPSGSTKPGDQPRRRVSSIAATSRSLTLKTAQRVPHRLAADLALGEHHAVLSAEEEIEERLEETASALQEALRGAMDMPAPDPSPGCIW
jgi:hypothetical protein